MASRPGGGGGGGGFGGFGFNMAFLKSKPGMILVGAVVLGTVAFALTMSAYNTGYYYRSCSAYGGLEYYCLYYNEDRCNLQQEAYDQHDENVKKRKEEYEALYPGQNIKFEEKGKRAVCPFGWLGAVPVFIILLCWIGIVILLIVIILFKQKPPQLPLLGSLVAGGLYGLSALLLLAFVVWAYVSRFPCTQGGNKEEESREFGSCSHQHAVSFDVLKTLFGVIFAIGTTAALVMFALMIRREGRVGPMMGGGGRMAQPQPTAPDAKHHHHHQQQVQPPGY